MFTSLSSLDSDALVRIMTEPKNAILKQYSVLFDLDNVELEFEHDAMVAIAEKALEQKTGARGLRGVVEGILTPLMFAVPSDPTIAKVIITKGCVDGESEPVLVLRSADDASYEEEKLTDIPIQSDGGKLGYAL